MTPPLPLAQVLLLAAGRGERMRPLTDHTPKPLLEVRGRSLLVWHLSALLRAEVERVCINTAWLGEHIPRRLGDRYTEGGRALSITYSMEGLDGGSALETAGGIVRALPLLDEVFWVAAGDVFMPGFAFDGEFARRFADSAALAHLWLVPNPEHHPTGDFGLNDAGLALNLRPDQTGPRYTYSTVGLFKRALFQSPVVDIPFGNPHGVKAPLGPVLRTAMDHGLVTASLYAGPWTDVGTVERLQALNAPTT